MKSNYKRIGDFIQLVDIRNEDLAIETLLGLSVSKQFIPSVANTIGTNMKKYKIIKKNQFACSIMQVRRDKKMPVAILKNYDEAIISQAYPVFEVIDTNELSPDYLMMWFSRSEFDRQATFWAVGGVRGSLEWEDFLNFEFPKPDIEEQKAIVAEYQTVSNRIKLNEQINTKLEETAQALYRHWFEVDFIKDSAYLEDLVIQAKETLNPNKTNFQFLEHYSIPSFDNNGLPSIESTKTIRSNKYKVKSNSILFSKLNPKFSRVWNIYGSVSKNAVCSTEFLVFTPNDIDYFGYIYFTMKSKNSIEYFTSMATGTSNSHQRIKPNEILKLKIKNFSKEKALEFSEKTKPFLHLIRLNLIETNKLSKLLLILLSKMAITQTRNIN